MLLGKYGFSPFLPRRPGSGKVSLQKSSCRSEHARTQHATQCDVVQIMARHLAVGPCSTGRSANMEGCKASAHSPSRLKPVKRAMIREGFCFNSTSGPRPSRSRTPGLNGSMSTSARQRSLFLLLAQPHCWPVLHLQLGSEHPDGAFDNNVFINSTPSLALRDTESDLLFLYRVEVIRHATRHRSPTEGDHLERTSVLKLLP